MSKVKDTYEDVKNVEMREMVEGWEEEIFEYASSSKEEMNELIKIYNEEKDLDDKLFLSDILVKLKYKKTIPSLQKIIADPDIGRQIWAAINLIKLENQSGVKAIKQISKKASEYDLDWIVDELNETDNKMAKDLLENLKNENKYIASLFINNSN